MDYVLKHKMTMHVHMFFGWNCFDLNMGVGVGGVSDIFVNYSASRPLFRGIFFSFNLIIINWTVFQLIQTAGWKRKEMVGFFSYEIDDLRYMFNHHPELHLWHFVQYDVYIPSQIVPPVFNQVSKFNMAMNSKWKPTSKQVFNHFIFPML